MEPLGAWAGADGFCRGQSTLEGLDQCALCRSLAEVVLEALHWEVCTFQDAVWVELEAWHWEVCTFQDAVWVELEAWQWEEHTFQDIEW